MSPPPSCPPLASLYLITLPLTAAEALGFARAFAEVLAAVPVSSVLVKLAEGSQGDAKAIVAPLLELAVKSDCALILDQDPRLAARLGADGVHVTGSGEALDEALESLKPERIVGAGGLPLRDDAMRAGEKGADYVMFGEPRGAAPPMPPTALVERVAWWAEIFETPCVAYAQSLDMAGELACAGADFVALDCAIWDASAPAAAAREARARLSLLGEASCRGRGR
ncbi:MAG: thiamine phosphate synthase [Hyphomicrobiales bacterium]|nr:thiamine phosphate synthase [Hyphomicrobiales bacterium]